jgi:prepilin-type N-terminal cleavage/methylation domain-containing protein
MRNSRGFTLIEMLVVILVIVILIGIGLAVGEQVKASSELALTKSELKGLQGALEWYEHKTAGQVPTDMLAFLEGYQRLHAYQITSGPNTGNWVQHKNFLTNLPASAVIMGTFPGPGSGTTQNMTGVIEILDGFGNPIQFVPATNTIANNDFGQIPSTYPYPLKSISKPYWKYSNVTPIQNPVYLFPAITSINTPGTTGSPLPSPSQVHAPCFFSFGTNYNSTDPSAMNYESYTYSYNP